MSKKKPQRLEEEVGSDAMDSAAVLVRATVNLPRLPAGTEALVDPTIPYIAGCLDKGLLVPVEEE